MRRATLERRTKETAVALTLGLDGGDASVSTGLSFFDHMLLQLAKHGGFELRIEARGDLEIDSHHLVEDVGLCLGDAFHQCLGDRAGIARFGDAHVPLDEALARVVVDFSGRPWCAFQAALPSAILGDGFQTEMVREFFIALASRAQMTLHATVLSGENTHHKIEALFKALARALRMAVRNEGSAVPSTKGTLTE